MPLPPTVGFAAPSGTGKSTAIVRLIGVLRARGFEVGVLKHDAHRLEFDKPGKDTWKFRQAGAERAVIAGDHAVAVFSAPTHQDGDVEGLIARWLADVDLVIVEGYRQAGLPCVRIHRREGPSPEGWTPPENIAAHFTDHPIESPLPQIGLDDAEAQADFVLDLLKLVRRATPS